MSESKKTVSRNFLFVRLLVLVYGYRVMESLCERNDTQVYNFRTKVLYQGLIHSIYSFILKILNPRENIFIE